VKFDLSDFLELDTKALLAVNGGASCSGGSCSSSVSKNTGSCGSSGSSYSGSCSSTGGSSYGGSCGTSGGNCGSFGGSCSSYGGSNVETSNGGGGNNDQPKETTPSYNIVGNSYAEVANAKPGDKMKKSEDEYIILTQGDIDWAKAQLEKNATNSESTKTDTELNEIIGVGSCGGTCGGVGTGDTGDMGNNGEVEGANGSGAGDDSIGDGGIGENDGNGGVSGWGKLTNETAKNSTMQDHATNKEVDSSMNGNNEFSKVGCKMEGASKILTEITGKDIDITNVNDEYDTNKDGLMTQTEITSAIEKNLSENQTVTSDYWEKQLTKETLDEIANSQEGTTYVLGRAEDVCGGQHWIVLEGYSINESGQVVFDYNGTSENDARNNRTYILGEPTAEQKANNYYQISKIETYTII
jgi:hypothetical protein